MRTKIFTICWLCLLSVPVLSQTEKGNFIISGRSNLEFVRSEGDLSYTNVSSPVYNIKISSFSLQAGVGYFIANNLAFGFSGNYKYENENKTKSNEISILPTLMYFIPLNSSFRPYAQAGFGYAGLTENSGLGKASFTGPAYGIGLGVVYFLNENVALDLGVQWTRSKLRFSEDNNLKHNAENLGVTIGLSLFF